MGFLEHMKPMLTKPLKVHANEMMPDSTQHSVTQQKMGNSREEQGKLASGSLDDMINHKG